MTEFFLDLSAIAIVVFIASIFFTLGAFTALWIIGKLFPWLVP
jgi:hypothetical protein